MSTIDNKRLPSQSGTELGGSGTYLTHGYITGEEYNMDLRGRRGNEKYEIMRRSDSTVRGALQVVKLPLQSTVWKVEPVQGTDGNISPEAQEKADFINRELFNRNINWHDFLRQALTMLDFGHSVFEKVFELTEFEGKARIGLAKLSSRKQVTLTSWETQDTHQPGVTQQLVDKVVSIPMEKLIVFCHDKEGDNYDGIPLLRYIYKEWDIKDKLILVNAMALEKLGIGVPVISAKDNMTPSPEDKTAAISALSNLRSNNKSYLMVPSTMTAEMMDMKGQSTKDVIPTLNYLDKRIMTSILAGFLEIGGASGSGSQSLSTDLTSLFMKSEEALANNIVNTIGTQLIKQLLDLNYADMSEGYPPLTFGQIADDDVSTLATGISALMNVRALTPDAEIEDHLRGIMRLPLMSKEAKDNYEENHKPVDDTPVDDPKPKPDPKKLKKDASIVSVVQAARDNQAKLLALLVEA
jgi:phage gp29-like protein